MTEKVTIGITCYKEGELLTRAWQSILDQTNDKWQAVIVIDGGADQKTVDIFHSIEHPRLLKYHFSKNAGPYATKTKSIDLAKTEWFYFLDGDDALPKNAIALFYENLDPLAGFYCGKCQLIKGEEITIVNKNKFDVNEMLTSFSYPFVVAFKRTDFFKLGGYAKELKGGRADFDLILNFIKNKVEHIYVNEIVYHYYLRENSVSKSYPHDIGFKHLVIYQRHKELFTHYFTKNYFLLLGLELSYLHYVKLRNKKLSLLYYRRVKKWVDLDYTLPTYLLYKLPFCLSKRLLSFKYAFKKT